MAKIIFNDCTFIDSLLKDNDILHNSIDINYSTFTNSEINVSANLSANVDNVNYSHNIYDWDVGGETFPELSAVTKGTIAYTEYNLSSTSADRGSFWSTSGIDTGFWLESRKTAGAWYFGDKGHIGSFYFGLQSVIEVITEPLNITLSLQTPGISTSPYSVDVNAKPLNIFLGFATPTAYNYNDITVDFVGVPRLGTSPLEVDFTATVTLLGELLANYSVSAYNWYFDHDRDTSISAQTFIPTTTYTFSGYSGKQFSIKLDALLNNITRGKYKENYITLCGRQQPVRFGIHRDINLREFLPEHLKQSDINDFIKVFEDYLNNMYSGNRGFGYSEDDL